MKNDIERILEDYEIDDSDGLSNDLQDYLEGQLEDVNSTLGFLNSSISLIS